jgi:protein SCO1
MMRHRSIMLKLIAAAFVAVACVVPALGQYNTPVTPGHLVLDDSIPKEMEGVDIVEKPNNAIALDSLVIDESGASVPLRSFFERGKPVILTLNYYTCPMLCTLTLNGLVDAMKGVDFTAGEAFTWVNVSINPNDNIELAANKKQNYLLLYARAGASQGVHFTTATAESSRTIANSVGYGYKLDERSGEYVHASALFICTPDGRMSRYLYGVKFEPATLRLALLEASEGKIGTTIDRFILWCHQYNPEANSYSLAAFRLMQLGGLVTLAILAAGLGWMWRRDLLSSRATSGVHSPLASP